MSSYQQMGHHSANLLQESNLDIYSGAILSPVNYTEAEISNQVDNANFGFDMIFDPQLYYPRTEREVLRNWGYFPTDVETADITSNAWWSQIIDSLSDVCLHINPSAMCSPVTVPRSYTDDHFSQTVEVGNMLNSALKGSSVRAVQTAIVSLSDLAVNARVPTISSILSRSENEELYLVFVSDLEPRRELKDPEELKGAMRLISSLENSGLNVLVGFASSELVLWKAAGASSCATGKFFNLRRFTSSRFEEPTGQGGGQLPYWFEESLLGFLRESDIPRLQQRNQFDPDKPANPYKQQILDRLDEEPVPAWVGLGWRQYMHGFADLESRIDEGVTDVDMLLQSAERKWLTLDDLSILMEEPRNDGSWLRAWRRALVEYQA